MTTTLAAQPTRAVSQARGPQFIDLLRSEWIKLFSVPAMYGSLLGIIATGVGGTLFLSLTLASSGPPSVANLEVTMGEVTMATVVIGQIIAGILGVLCIGAEYSSGSIQSTLLAVPTRVRVLLAKAAVMFGSVTATALVTVFGAWAVSYPFYAPFGLEAPLTAPGVAGSLIGSAAYLGFCAVFGLGLGAIVRSSTVGSILVFFATLLGPVLTSVLPFGLLSRVLRLMLIGNAGDAMSRIPLPGAPFLDLWGGHISPGAGWLLAGGWAIIALIGGAIVLQRRDA